MFKITEFLKANFWPYSWQETREFFIATNPWLAETNDLPYVLGVRTGIIFGALK